MKKNNFIGKVFITKNFRETQRLGYDFAKVLRKGDVICLYGDLGSGKTTFVQGLAEGLGVKNRIISPTFIITRCYKLKTQKSNVKTTAQNSKLFYHIDLYRIGGNDIRGLGLEEILNDSSNIVAIEWAEKLKNNLPQKRTDIEFFYEKDNVRKIVFKSLNQ